LSDYHRLKEGLCSIELVKIFKLQGDKILFVHNSFNVAGNGIYFHSHAFVCCKCLMRLQGLSKSSFNA